MSKLPIGFGRKGRLELSRRYEAAHMTRSADGIEVDRRGLVYLWHSGEVAEPARLHVGSDPKTLGYNTAMVNSFERMRDSMNASRGDQAILVLFRPDYGFHDISSWGPWSQYDETDKKTAAEWSAIEDENRFLKWRRRGYGNVTHIKAKAKKEKA